MSGAFFGLAALNRDVPTVATEVCSAFCDLAGRNRDMAGVATEVSGAFCDLAAKDRELRRGIVFVVGAAVRPATAPEPVKQEPSRCSRFIRQSIRSGY